MSELSGDDLNYAAALAMGMKAMRRHDGLKWRAVHEHWSASKLRRLISETENDYVHYTENGLIALPTLNATDVERFLRGRTSIDYIQIAPEKWQAGIGFVSDLISNGFTGPWAEGSTKDEAALRLIAARVSI